MTKQKRPVLIAGGGIGGLSTSIALARAGIETPNLDDLIGFARLPSPSANPLVSESSD